MMRSELLEALRSMLATLPRPGMLRPDLYTMRHSAIVAALESFVSDGLVVEHDGAYVPRELLVPDVPDRAHIGRVGFSLGLIWHPMGERLRAAGRRTSEFVN